MKRGLDKASTKTEEVVKVSADKAIRYRVVEEVIDLRSLREELEYLEAPIPEPNIEELAELGKMIHPHYTKEENPDRVAEIKEILGE